MANIRAIAARCESIGRNCEFGLVQRYLNLEPVGLLRWAGSETAAGLIDGLRNGFVGLAEKMDGVHAPNDGPLHQRHWWLTCRRYGILFHTDQRPSLKTADEATEKVRPRLRRLAERLFEDIRLGEKVFVYSSAEFSDPLDGLPLIDAFRCAGGRGPLLIVAAGSEQDVEQIDHNTYGVVLPRLTAWNGATGLDQAAWERIIPQLTDIVAEAAPA
jgi:hypothetical protein